MALKHSFHKKIHFVLNGSNLQVILPKYQLGKFILKKTDIKYLLNNKNQKFVFLKILISIHKNIFTSNLELSTHQSYRLFLTQSLKLGTITLSPKKNFLIQSPILTPLC